MEEEKDILLDAWSRLKIFVYNYPLSWFFRGYLVATATFLLHFFPFIFSDRGDPNPFRSLLTFIIIFSFSIINIAANYDKSRSKIKWLFWDCLASMYLLCFSFGYLMTFIDSNRGLIIIFNFSVIDYVVGGVLFIFESFLKNHFSYIPFMGRLVGFKDLDGFFIFIPIFISIIGYDIYRKKAIKEILRTRCFLMLVMLSLSRISLLMAILLA